MCGEGEELSLQNKQDVSINKAGADEDKGAEVEGTGEDNMAQAVMSEFPPSPLLETGGSEDMEMVSQHSHNSYNVYNSPCTERCRGYSSW